VANDEPFLLKDLFDRKTVGEIADAVEAALPSFDRAGFLERVFDEGWSGRELKQRMRHVTSVLHGAIPGAYRDQLRVLLAAADHAVEGFAALVYSDFVQAYGTGDWEASVPALARFTRLASAEFAIRPFIAADRDRTLAQMLEWAGDPDPAVRRLATEGCRPRLPWGMRLHDLVADPAPVLPILEQLHTDPDESVRRSVANNLNDISRDHPDVVLDLLRAWQPEPGTNTYRLARHALRTLLKRGQPAALEILGFKAGLSVRLDSLKLEPPAPVIGGNARLTFVMVSTLESPQPVMVDYAVHYVKADGGTSPKVFRLGSVVLQPGETVTYSRKLSFRQMTTRFHRPGVHRVEILANGASAGDLEFELGNPPANAFDREPAAP
jgi:3-methyladenine DNA glycosylase AlkC